ncbi:MAG: MacB family efflux pump subunit [Cardiobacteriaceae bacterium]|nr:MacB family efflux pump subunit [Cardiobacteriaceae bacterium]
MTPLISIKNLRRQFQNGDQIVEILKGLDLEIQAGEMIAIIGQSGSGKSTLMNILGTLDTATSGEYFIKGQNVSNLSPEERAQLRREHIGFIFQRYHLIVGLSAWENVAMPAVYAGMGLQERETRAKALLTRLGLSERIHHYPNQLSGGQQQRVSIARALMNGGEIIFADEPTGALDSRSGAEVMTILRELHAEGHTVILVTHDREIADHADRVIELKDGEILRDERKVITTSPNKALPPAQPKRHSLFGQLGNALSMAVRAIFGHKLRAFLTMLGIIIGIASVVSMVALGQGSQQQVLAQISDLGSNTIEVFPGTFGDRRSFRIRTLIPDDATVLAEQSFIDSATPVVNSSSVLRYQAQSLNANITGVGEQYLQVYNLPLAAGRNFNRHDIEGYHAVALINQEGATKLFSSPQSALGEVVLLENVPVKIIGVIDTSKNQRLGGNNNQIMMLMPYTAAMNRLLGRSHLSSLVLRIRDGVEAQMAEDAITRILERRHRAKDFSLFNSDQIRKAITETSKALTLLISTIAAIALLVGGIGVMNIMLVSVTERTQEIGIRMAIGARQRDIMQQFLIESLMLCFMGGAIGVGLAYALGYVPHLLGSDMRLIYSSQSIVVAVLCSTGIGLLFGYLPARNAARLDPVEALSRE